MVFLQMCEKKDLKNLQRSGLLRCSHCGINHLSPELRVAAQRSNIQSFGLCSFRLQCNAEPGDCPGCVKVLVGLACGEQAWALLPRSLSCESNYYREKTLEVEISTQVCVCLCIYMVRESLLLSRKLLQEQHVQNPLTLLLKCR